MEYPILVPSFHKTYYSCRIQMRKPDEEIYPEGSHGNGQGNDLFQMNPETGALTPRAVFPNGANPSWLAFDPTGTHLYAANETAYGSVSAYSIDRANGQLTLLNAVGSEGAGPAHLSVHPSGKMGCWSPTTLGARWPPCPSSTW